MQPVKLSAAHVDAVNRARRLILHYDFSAASMRQTPWGTKEIDELDDIIDFYTKPYEADSAAAVDSVFYEIGEGYPAMWPSNIIKRASVVFPKWWDAGIDPMDVMIKQTQKVGREVFVTFRMAGADVEGDDEFTDHRQSRWNEEGP